MYNRELEELREENYFLNEEKEALEEHYADLRNKNISLKKLNKKLKRKIEYLRDYLNEVIEDDNKEFMQEIYNKLSIVIDPYKTKHVSTSDIINVNQKIRNVLDAYEDEIQTYMIKFFESDGILRNCFKISLEIEGKKEVIYLEI